MRPYRVQVGDSLCARAAGAEQVALALGMAAREVKDEIAVVPVGCDGTCWAQPVVTRFGGPARDRRYERVRPEDAAALLAESPSEASRGMPWGMGVERERQRTLGQDPAVNWPEPPDSPYAGQTRRLLARCGDINPDDWTEATGWGDAYAGLKEAYAFGRQGVVDLVKASGLRGRGGAYFPIALKWESVIGRPGPRYLVVNAEEGEPGAFKDRHLMEGNPHLVLEGIAIAAHAIDAEVVFLYINGQAGLSYQRMSRAVADFHPLVFAGSEFPLRIEIYRGAGGYVCGEESVILNSIEGERAVPRPRPPLPTEAGLFGRPTVISNVETLCNLPFILTEGVEAFRSVGTEEYPGTKLVSLSGAVQRPGLYEVPLGVTTRALLELGGGLQPGRSLRAVVMGGPSGGFLSPEMLDLPLTGGLVHPTGAVLGSGGVVVLDDRMPLSLALRELTAYNAAESCGKCTPCREGSARALAILDRAGESGRLDASEREEILEICDLMQYASLCGLGQMAPGPIRSALALFP